MKKYTLNFGKFKQYDKKFITEIDGSSVTSVNFYGETLYIATNENTFEYSEGNLKKLSFKAEKLFSENGKLYASQGKVLAEIKNGKSKKIAEFESSVVDISIALDGSFWLITEDALYLNENGEFFLFKIKFSNYRDTLAIDGANFFQKHLENYYIYIVYDMNLNYLYMSLFL